MKTIYQFSYQFKQEKRGLMNYKTFIIANERSEAVFKFAETFPHVDFRTVEVSEFKGSIIDSCEPVG